MNISSGSTTLSPQTSILYAPPDFYNYTLTVVDENGCIGTDTVIVTLNSDGELVVTATATPGHICLGQQSQLTAVASGGTEDYTYSWLPDDGSLTNLNIANPIAMPNATTTYTATVNDGNNTVSVDVTVTVDPTPGITNIEDLSICSGESVNFSPQSNVAGTTFEWSSSNNTPACITGASSFGDGDIVDVLENSCTAQSGTVVYAHHAHRTSSQLLCG